MGTRKLQGTSRGTSGTHDAKRSLPKKRKVPCPGKERRIESASQQAGLVRAGGPHHAEMEQVKKEKIHKSPEPKREPCLIDGREKVAHHKDCRIGAPRSTSGEGEYVLSKKYQRRGRKKELSVGWKKGGDGAYGRGQIWGRATEKTKFLFSASVGFEGPRERGERKSGSLWEETHSS